MPNNKLTLLEQETIIEYNRAEKDAHVATRIPKDIRKLKKYGCEPYREQSGYYDFNVPKSWIKISPPKRVSSSQRIAAKKNLENYRRNNTNS